MFEMLEAFLKAQDTEIEVKRNHLLAKVSPIGIGGCASYVLYPKNEYVLKSLLSILISEQIQYRVVGRMSNILPSDDKYTGVIVRTDRLSYVKTDKNILSVGCGAMLGAAAAIAARAELSGMEELAAIPGSIGGSILGNAGAFGREICDILRRIRVYDTDEKREYVFNVSELEFSYRHTSLDGNRYLILGADIELSKEKKVNIINKMLDCKQKRLATQPIGAKTLGSTFKRCNGHSAGELIDACGLKGLSVFDAQISTKHAGFIINNGRARAKDVLELMKISEEAVENQFGVRLEREIIVM